MENQMEKKMEIEWKLLYLFMRILLSSKLLKGGVYMGDYIR